MNLETNDTSFESPNIEIPDSEIKIGVASSGGLPHNPGVRLSFEGDYLSGATIYCVITVFEYVCLRCKKETYLWQ